MLHMGRTAGRIFAEPYEHDVHRVQRCLVNKAYGHQLGDEHG